MKLQRGWAVLLIKFFFVKNHQNIRKYVLGIGTRLLDPITRVLEYLKSGLKIRVPGYSILDDGITIQDHI